jgi:hypothetical protein
MTRRIAVAIGNGDNIYCYNCPKLGITSSTEVYWCNQYDKRLKIETPKYVIRCTACRKAEIREEVKP